MNSFYEKLASYSMNQILGFGLVAAAMYYFMAYDDGSSMRGQIEGINQKIAQEQVKQKETQAAMQEAEMMKATVAGLSQQYVEVSKRIPSTLMSIDINKSIDDFARRAGVSVKQKRPAAIIVQEIIDEVPVDVVLEGTYAELAQFIYFVSSSERLMRVHNFTLTLLDSGNRRAGAKLKFEGQIVGYKLGTGVKKE